MSISTAYYATVIMLSLFTYNLLSYFRPSIILNEKKEIRKFRTFILSNFINTMIMFLIVRFYPQLIVNYMKMLHVIE